MIATIMSPTLISRIAGPTARVARNAAFSTKPLASDALSATPASKSWKWSNLSPRTRQYVVVGLGVGTCVDTYVLYNYWPQIFGSK